jgi:hypothetical protein
VRSGTVTVCPGCDRRVEPDDADVLYAVKLERLDSFGGTEYLEGMGGFFHNEMCFARVRDWRRKGKPS